MEFNITARHFDLSNALRNFVMEKFSKLDKYFRGTVQADVIMSVEKHRQIIEITVHGNRTKFVGKEETNDMYSSIDMLVESIEQQIKRKKEKEATRKTKSLKGVKGAAFAAENRVISYDILHSESVGRGNQEHRIVHTKKFEVKPMSVDEAALQLGIALEDFLVFRNAITERVNVIYKRKDGHYGHIEPED